MKITFSCQILVQTEISRQIKITFRYRTQEEQLCQSGVGTYEMFTNALLKIQVLGILRRVDWQMEQMFRTIEITSFLGCYAVPTGT